MAKPVRIAVIGLGSMGANHARVLAGLPDAGLVAVADPNAARLGEYAHGATAYADYRELLANERLDAVTIAVPTRLHLEVALACVERGLPLLVEKPIATDAEEGEELRAAAEAGGVPLMAGHIERFNPAVRELKRRLAAGEAGRVLELRARRVGPFYQRQRDVGVVHDLATHDIDVMRDLLGCEVERVQAETQEGVLTQYEDALTGLLRFEDGAIGVLDVNWLTPVKVRELVVLGERGMFVVDYIAQELRFRQSDAAEVLAHPEVWPPKLPSAPVEEGLTLVPVVREEPLRAELAAFLAVVRGEASPPVSAADAIAALRVAEALVEAGRRGSQVRVAAGRAS
ncbi:MAG: Gfo/Idh/MocA family oxidoreductase [Dehalococcoidia bacterium]